MAVEDIAAISGDILKELGRIGSWLQAIGVIVVVWLVFQLVSLIINTRKLKEMNNIKTELKRLEEKIDKLRKK